MCRLNFFENMKFDVHQLDDVISVLDHARRVMRGYKREEDSIVKVLGFEAKRGAQGAYAKIYNSESGPKCKLSIKIPDELDKEAVHHLNESLTLALEIMGDKDE